MNEPSTESTNWRYPCCDVSNTTIDNVS